MTNTEHPTPNAQRPTPNADTTVAVVAPRTGVPPTGYAWWVVGVLTAAYVLSFIDRQILNLLVKPIRRDLGINDTQMSLLMGFSFALFYTFFGIPLGRLADTAHRRNLIGAGVVFWSLMTAFCGLARSYGHFLLARIGVGIGEAALSPAAYSLIADYFPKERRATAISVYSMGIFIGSGLAMLLGGMVIKFASGQGTLSLPLIGQIHPWQLVFLVLGAVGVLFSLTLLTIREPVRQRNAAKPGEEENRENAPLPMSAVLAYIRAHRATFLCHNFGFAFLALAGYGMSAWLPTLFIRRHGWEAQEIGLVYGLAMAIAGTLGIVLGGILADRMLRRGYTDATLRVGLIAALATPLFGGLCLFAPTGPSAAIWLFPVTLFGSIPFGVAPAAVQQMVPPAMRGQASALYLFIVSLIGLGLGPTAVAVLTDYVFRSDLAVHLSLATVMLIAHLAAVVLLRQGLAPFRRTLEQRPE